MFFVLSKIFWLLAQPISLALVLTTLSLILVFFSRRRAALTSTMAAVMIVGLSGYTTLGYLMIRPLEERFSVPTALPSNVSAIIVLGGATHARPSTARQTVALNEAGERLTTALALAQIYPQAPIVLSGGSGLFDETESEAETMRRFFTSYGIADDRLVAEGQSRNTDENSKFTADLLGQSEGDVILVTSAFHTPRSVGLFREQGVEVIAWPTDYRSSGTEALALDIANPVHNLNLVTVAGKEWIGLAAYSITGRIAEILPGPTQ